MAIRATGGFGILRYEPGNPEFPTLPDGVIVPHILTYPDGGGERRYPLARPSRTQNIRASAPGNDEQRFAGWQTQTTWVNPAIVDFGVIPSPVQRTVSLYNARPVAVEVTALSLPSGVSLVSPSLPVTLEAYDGVTFTLEASTTGDNEFDEFHVFTTSTGDVTFRLIGRRVFTLNNIPQAPMIEVLRFKTDILRSTDGTEKAYGLLQSPLTDLEYEVWFTDDLQRIRFKNRFIAGASALVVAAQKWYEARPLLVAAQSTDTVLQVNTVNTSFSEEQPISVVSPDGETVAAAQISSLDVSPENTSIVLSSEIGAAFEAGSSVMPVGLGYISAFPRYDTYAKNLETARYRVTLNQEVDQSALDPSFPMLTNLKSPEETFPVLDFCNEISGRAKGSNLRRSEDVLESGLTNRIAFNDFPYGDHVQEFRITLESPAEVWKWRTFLHYMRGSYNVFYVPTFTNDIPGVTTTVGSNIFTAQDTDLALLFGTTPVDRRNAIRLLYPDGSIYYRFITAVVDNITTEQITVDSVLIDGTPEISYLQKARILGDTASFTHNREDDVILRFKFRTILT